MKVVEVKMEDVRRKFSLDSVKLDSFYPGTIYASQSDSSDLLSDVACVSFWGGSGKFADT